MSVSKDHTLEMIKAGLSRDYASQQAKLVQREPESPMLLIERHRFLWQRYTLPRTGLIDWTCATF